MGIDFKTMCLDPVFNTLGVWASLVDPRDGKLIALKVIDADAAVSLGDISVATSRPALSIRQSSLAEVGLTSDEIINATIWYLGKAYRIRDANAAPAPGLGLNAIVNLIIVVP